MNAQHTHLTNIAFKLMQSDDPADHRAAAWINANVKREMEQQRKRRGPALRKVKLSRGGKGAEFYLSKEALDNS